MLVLSEIMRMIDRSDSLMFFNMENKDKSNCYYLYVEKNKIVCKDFNENKRDIPIKRYWEILNPVKGLDNVLKIDNIENALIRIDISNINLIFNERNYINNFDSLRVQLNAITNSDCYDDKTVVSILKNALFFVIPSDKISF